MSEAELHFIRARLPGGELSKARRANSRSSPTGWYARQTDPDVPALLADSSTTKPTPKWPSGSTPPA